METLWAIISVDKKGREGICLIQGLHGPVLAVTGTESVLKMYTDLVSTMDARAEAHAAGMKIRVVEFERKGTKDI